MALNKEDGGKRQCILVTNNEKTELNPNGIALDVTSKRLKRIMSGVCYDGTSDFKWLEKNEPFEDNLEVLDIKSVSKYSQEKGVNPLDLIDERAYDLPKFDDISQKAEWIAKNFAPCLKECESDEEYQSRPKREQQ